MKKSEAGKPLSSDNPFPVLSVGGLLTGPECTFWYKRLLDDKLEEWELPPEDRFIPMPDRGLGQHEEMLKRVEEKILEKTQKLGRTAVIVGHSMGALFAEEAVLNNPEVAAEVVAAAGVHDGQKYETLATLILRYGLGNPKQAKNLKHNSELMIQHRERIAAEWPEGVGLHVVSTAYDSLLPFIHGLKFDVPEGQHIEGSVIALPLPGTAQVARFLTKNPSITHLRSLRPALHIDIVRHPAFINYVRGLQQKQQPQALPPDLDGEMIALAA